MSNDAHRLLGLIIDWGGSPAHDFIGGRFWHDPGPFHNGFSGFLSVVGIASFAYAGTEITGLNAAETRNPDKNVPKALKRVFWRITIVRIVYQSPTEHLANRK